MQPRYFIGVTLPDELTKKIEKLQQELLFDKKVMEPLVPHITLLHPNILMTLSPLYLIPKVKVLAKDFLPLGIELSKTAKFDSRVLYIAVKSPELTKLQKRLVELLPDDVRARYEIGRDYTPHITLAQAKPLQSLPDELVTEFQKEIDPLLPRHFKAQGLNKFTWLKPRNYKVEIIR